MFITYTDLPVKSFTLQCYSLSEVLIEKMVALMGRTETRDLYDFWYLMEIEGMAIQEHDIAFSKNKAKHKGQKSNEWQKDFEKLYFVKTGLTNCEIKYMIYQSLMMCLEKYLSFNTSLGIFAMYYRCLAFF